jgi:flagellar biosynthesis regulator FlaF
MSTMQIRSLFIAGIPARVVRDAMRRARHRDAFTHSLFVEECKVPEHKAREIIKALVSGNFVEVVERPGWADRERKRWYKATAEGVRLSNATGLRRMPRSKADAMLADFLKRVQEVNAHPEYIYRISTVIVSGSYARGESTLGDLDIFYGLEPRSLASDQKKAERIRIDAARIKGRLFSNIVDELYWPEHEVRLHLKARTLGLSLHSLDEFFRMEKDNRFAYKVLVGDVEIIAARLESAARSPKA